MNCTEEYTLYFSQSSGFHISKVYFDGVLKLIMVLKEVRMCSENATNLAHQN